jgi:hypothetical protein
MTTERDIHTATVIRLQVAHNAIEASTPALSYAILDLSDIAKRLAACGEDAAAEDVHDMQTKLAAVLPLLRAALDIARGARTDIPPELRASLAPDASMLTRFLELPAGNHS